MRAKKDQAKISVGPTEGTEAPNKRRRVPRGTRKDRIIEEAARYFADHGFAASTRDLARSMGVTQALLYRYFPSKQDLIDHIFEAAFIDRWEPEWEGLIRDRTLSLEKRLTQFYEAYVANLSYVSMRLFMRGALDGQGFPDRYTAALNDRILKPIVAELRHAVDLPRYAKRRQFNGERELAMMLHGSIVFLSIRKNIYGTPLPDDLGPQLALYVHTFVAGAKKTLKDLHKKPAPKLFKMPVIGSNAKGQ